VRGPRGTGLTKQQIIDTFARRLHNHPDFERAEALRNIHRIVEIRLNDKFGAPPRWASRCGTGTKSWPSTATPALPSTASSPSPTSPTRTAPAPSASASNMREAGFDEVHIDAVGNVVGRYHADLRAPGGQGARTLMTGSHYDTVRNGGKYDGRLGIFVPMACVRELRAPAAACRSASR
jgi:N-carbamoyl-L-amino-acid hydrolase